MVRDHRQYAAGYETVPELRQRAVQPSELVVHGDTDSLKDAREIARSGAGTERAANGSHQIVAGDERTIRAPAHDFTRQSPGAWLVRILAKDARQLELFALVQHGRGVAIRVGAHSHVERRPLAKREAAPRFVDLMRRDPEIDEDAVEAASGERRHRLQVGIVGEQGMEASVALPRREPVPRDRERVGVAVHRPDLLPRFEERERVTASAERRIEHGVRAGEQLQHFGGEHRRVIRAVPLAGVGGGHRSAGAGLRAGGGLAVAAGFSHLRAPMRTPRHLVLVVHGARAEAPAIRDLIDELRAAGHHVEPRITLAPGDAVRFAREGADAGTDAVVAIGGDGTINEVLNGLDGHATPMGIVPFGTANDFARQTGIPLDEPSHAMDLILRRKPRRVDTGEVNGRRFLNVSTGGVGAEATAETPLEAKEALGILAYAITGVRKFVGLESTRGRFTVGDKQLETAFLAFAVGNARATGGGTIVAPAASLTDGLLDLCIVDDQPRAQFARLLLRLKKGEHLGEEGVHYVQAPEILVETDRPITVNVDGEALTADRFAYHVRPLDLRLHLGHLPERRRKPRPEDAAHGQSKPDATRPAE